MAYLYLHTLRLNRRMRFTIDKYAIFIKQTAKFKCAVPKSFTQKQTLNSHSPVR